MLRKFSLAGDHSCRGRWGKDDVAPSDRLDCELLRPWLTLFASMERLEAEKKEKARKAKKVFKVKQRRTMWAGSALLAPERCSTP